MLRRAANYYSKNIDEKVTEGTFFLDGTFYEAEDNLGAGAFGIVCKAMDTRSKKHVAIKKLPNAFKSKSTAKCALREIRILYELKHENILDISDVFFVESWTKKDIYLVLDLMETDLHQVLQSDQILNEKHFCYFLYQLLKGLKFLHSAGVVHRDLKPSNLLLNANCLLKIGDFGMARSIGGATLSTSESEKSSRRDSNVSGHLSQYVSTLWYRSPELLLSMGEYDTKVDIWSAGCIFAEMLLRREIFPGTDSYSQIKLILDFLGTPEEKVVQKITSPNIRDYIVFCGPRTPKSFTKMFPESSNEARELLKTLLQISPWRRETADELVKNSYFSKWQNSENEPKCSSKSRKHLQELEQLDDNGIKRELENSEKIFKIGEKEENFNLKKILEVPNRKTLSKLFTF